MMSTGLEGVGRSFLHLPGLLVHFDPCWGEQAAETLGLRPQEVGEGVCVGGGGGGQREDVLGVGVMKVPGSDPPLPQREGLAPSPHLPCPCPTRFITHLISLALPSRTGGGRPGHSRLLPLPPSAGHPCPKSGKHI